MTKPFRLAPAQVARRTADCVVILADGVAKDANPFYMHRARPLLQAVTGVLAGSRHAQAVDAAEALRRLPADAERHRALQSAVADALAKDRDFSDRLSEAVEQVNARSRISYHLGEKYSGSEAQAPKAAIPDRPADARPAAEPVAHIVLPFRDASPAGERLDNLVNCLLALRDQSLPRSQYLVTVVECDVRPRWREQLRPLTDEYVYTYKDGAFNRSWSLNVGVVHSGRRAPYVCVLDADALVDRSFVERNVERFSSPAVGGFLPFTDLLYLDGPSSRRAVDQRVSRRAPDVDLDHVRGFLVHRASGMCAWVRRDVYEEMGGFDERYEGWGGEDLDFVFRLQQATAFRYFADPLLHIHHPVAPDIVDADGRPTGILPQMLTWKPDGPIGRIEKFRHAGALREGKP
ncbi:glycosyltransferase [Streptomyces sp. NPDC003016]